MADTSSSIGSIIDFFEWLITDFTWRRIGIVVAFLTLVVSGFYTFEVYTRSFMLTRLDREVSLLERILKIQDQTAKANDEELKRTFEGLKSKLGQLVPGASLEFQMSHRLVKGLYFGLPWMIIILIMFLAGTENAGAATAGVLAVAIPVMFLGANLPDFEQVWINRLLPWISCVLIVGAIMVYQRRKA